jgi:hypothetical protein
MTRILSTAFSIAFGATLAAAILASAPVSAQEASPKSAAVSPQDSPRYSAPEIVIVGDRERVVGEEIVITAIVPKSGDVVADATARSTNQ